MEISTPSVTSQEACFQRHAFLSTHFPKAKKVKDIIFSFLVEFSDLPETNIVRKHYFSVNPCIVRGFYLFYLCQNSL